MDYFEPKLWIGMIATPDKRDDNIEERNIYEIFDSQIACEIRLQDAMEEDFEHFGYLTATERVANVMRQAQYFGYSGERVKGLIFCSKIEKARQLSEKFNERGWRTLVLSGNDSEEVRVTAIERLAGDEGNDAIDYIISVDIFSEGVDVPEIN